MMSFLSLAGDLMLPNLLLGLKHYNVVYHAHSGLPFSLPCGYSDHHQPKYNGVLGTLTHPIPYLLFAESHL